MRELANVIAWVEALARVPRDVAVALVVLGASMLFVGLRYWRIYMGVATAVPGWFLGVSLATLMGVSRWYVSPAAALLCGALGFFSAPFLVPLLVGVLFAAAVATVIGPELDTTTLWLVGGGGLATGTALAILFQRFATALLYGSLGALCIVGAVRPLLGHPGGGLGAALDNRVAWAIGATVLLVFAMIAQPALEPEAEDVSS
jgi:hypothetical protein